MTVQRCALTVDDAPQLARIELATTAYPWRETQFAAGLAGAEFGWGLRRHGELVAFAVFNAVLDEATLLNIAVHPAQQRQGAARDLLAFALTQLSTHALARCLLEVRIGNSAAIGLYRALGFTDDGVRRHYYPASGGREHALLMSRPLP